MDINKLVNWAELSKYLSETNSKQTIRPNKIPQKYKKEVNQLLTYISAWVKDEKLITETRIKDNFKAYLPQISQNIQDCVENSISE